MFNLMFFNENDSEFNIGRPKLHWINIGTCGGTMHVCADLHGIRGNFLMINGMLR
jgi:hypothetical protein